MFAALAALAAPGADAADPRWFADGSGGGTVAKWGIAESDAVGFSVGCESGFVVVSPELYAVEEPAASLTIRFSVDGKPYDRRATLTYDETINAWHAKAKVADDDALIEAMRKGKRLTYDFDPPLRDGDAFTVSLSGSAKVIDEALEGC
jgi:hypothetical protein